MSGGGFGQKVLLFYPDELLVPMAAMQLGRPVKYIEDRRENFIGSSQERTQIHTIELCARKTGEVIALRDSFLHDTGAFIPYGIAVAQVASTSIAGPYRIPQHLGRASRAVYTPTVPVTPYRGCGRPQSCFAIERAMDQLAEELGLDRFEVRRRNLIARRRVPLDARGPALRRRPARQPRQRRSIQKALTMVLEKLGCGGFAAEQEGRAARASISASASPSMSRAPASAPMRAATSRSTRSPARSMSIPASPSQGQGHETVFAQIVADQLGVEVEDVILVEGDTRAFDWGVATFASRAAVVSGNAIYKAALLVREQTIQAAANMLEAERGRHRAPRRRRLGQGHRPQGAARRDRHRHQPAALRLQRGRPGGDPVRAREPPRRPAARRGPAPGLEATDYYSPACSTWAYGVHAADRRGRSASPARSRSGNMSASTTAAT